MTRYENLYSNYRGMGFDAKALLRAALCAQKIGDSPKAKKLQDVLAREFPGSDELKKQCKGS